MNSSFEAEIQEKYTDYLQTAKEIQQRFWTIFLSCLVVTFLMYSSFIWSDRRVASWLMLFGLGFAGLGVIIANKSAGTRLNTANLDKPGFRGFFKLYRNYYWANHLRSGKKYQEFLSLIGETSSPERIPKSLFFPWQSLSIAVVLVVAVMGVFFVPFHWPAASWQLFIPTSTPSLTLTPPPTQILGRTPRSTSVFTYVENITLTPVSVQGDGVSVNLDCCTIALGEVITSRELEGWSIDHRRLYKYTPKITGNIFLVTVIKGLFINFPSPRLLSSAGTVYIPGLFGQMCNDAIMAYGESYGRLAAYCTNTSNELSIVYIIPKSITQQEFVLLIETNFLSDNVIKHQTIKFYITVTP